MDTLSGILLSVLFGFVPMFIFAALVYWLDRYEKEPVILLGAVFLWGAIVAAGSAFLLNTILGMGVYLFTGSEAATELTTASLFAPIIEESLKGLAVLIVFLVFRSEFDSIMDGIVYAAITALGFAATENAFYIFSYGYADNGITGLIYTAFVRIVLVGWQHTFFTAFTGIGLAIARLNQRLLVKLAAPLLGWTLAVFAHAFHNIISNLASGSGGLFLSTFIDWSGWFVMFLFILWALSREQHWLIDQLRDEVPMGTISPAQYHTACSAWAQSGARVKGILSGSFQATDRFYRLTAELAYKKQQRAMLGDENGNAAKIERLRGELARLSTLACA
jgi:RsiW-degrading membrane proteinase PrsW (M82 family)